MKAKSNGTLELKHATLGEFSGVWCGRAEGWLTYEELVRRTKRDVLRYALEQPLKWRHACQQFGASFSHGSGRVLARRRSA